MAGLTCSHCQQSINLFKTGGGEPLILAYKDSTAAIELRKIIDKLIKRLSMSEMKSKKKAL